MRFAHLSDFHFTNLPGNFPVLRSDLLQALQAIVSDLCQVEQYLDFIAITGDLGEDGRPNSYQSLKHMLNVLSVPVLVVPGNHDAKDAFGKAFAPPGHLRDTEQLDYFVDIADARIIGIDSVDYGKTTGILTQAQLTWLESVLPTISDPPNTIVLIHHPPFLIGRSEFDALSDMNLNAELAEILRAQNGVTLLCGHVHRPYYANWAGASCFIAGSPSCQLSANPPFGSAPLQLVDEPYAYFLHSIDEDGDSIVSTRYVAL